jgi:single-stranded-DNA-specific exonuclease
MSAAAAPQSISSPVSRAASPAAARGPSEAEPRIELSPYDLSSALALERSLGISHVLSQVLVRRGLSDPEAARSFLDEPLHHDPAAFGESLTAAVELIRGHLRSRSRIVVHGDYDVDGVCATAILVRALRGLGAEPHWYIPSRLSDGYGLASATVSRLADQGTELLITVDCGITAAAEVRVARSLGIDVLVTDHHAPPAHGVLPDCTILHPRLAGYPSAELCGTGVAFKLAQALGAPSAEEDLELVALATVADLVPLTGENRTLVREGLTRLAATRRPGLRALLEVSRTDPSALDAAALGFRLAPRINAAGRLRRADAGLELLLTEDPGRAREIALELDRVNAERRAIEQRMTWEAEALAGELGERPAYVLAREGWHPGVVGIVASRIVERFHRPAILIAIGEAPEASGSARSIPGFDVLAAIGAGAEHLVRFGGHRAAAGLTIAPERIDAFRCAVERHAAQTLTPELIAPAERVDAVVSAGELTFELAEELARLEPCGIGNPAVSLLATGARFESVRAMGERGSHARFAVVCGGARAAAVAFGCEGRLPGSGGEPLDASFRLERNVWRGAVEPRLVLRRATPPRPAGAIELLGTAGEYLACAFAELDRPLASKPFPPAHDQGGGGEPAREVIDRRGGSPLAVLADARAAGAAPGGGAILAVCADVTRRLPGLSRLTGGFALIDYQTLVECPELTRRYRHLVAIDPPADRGADQVLRRGHGFVHLAWGAAELRFSQQMHELEYALRSSLVTLYRSLRRRRGASGEELEPLLRGDPDGARPARLAGRLLRVLTELELVSLDRDLPALVLADARPTRLERSLAYRAYVDRYEDGLRYLSRAAPSPAI